MAATFALVFFAAIALVVGLMFLGVTLQPTRREWFARKTGASIRVFGLAVVATLVTTVGFAALGAFPETRGGMRVLGLVLVVLGVGFVGLGAGVANVRTCVRFLARGDTPTGEVTAGPVAVTGLVAHEDSPESPFFGTRAVAWEWAVEARNRHGMDAGWEVARTGGDGVAFRVDDGSGPVTVASGEARLDIATETTEERDPGDPPGEAATVADLDVGGDRFRFRESALTLGTEVTVLGVARGDPPTLVAAPDEPFVVTDGARRVALRRYALRALAFGVGGGLATFLGLAGLSASFGVPLPV